MHPDIKNTQIRDMFVLGLRKCHKVAGCGLAFPRSETLRDKALRAASRPGCSSSEGAITGFPSTLHLIPKR